MTRERAVVIAQTLAAVLLLALAGTGAVRGAEPPTLGATIGATVDTLVVASSANIATVVDVEMPEGWTAERTSFEVAPGETVRSPITATGPDGYIVATQRPAVVIPGTDQSTVVLTLGTPRPPGFPWHVVAFWLIGLAALLYIGRRIRRRGLPRLVWDGGRY